MISNKELLYLSRTVETILEEWTIFINRCIKNILKNDTKLVNYDFFVLEEKKIFDFFPNKLLGIKKDYLKSFHQIQIDTMKYLSAYKIVGKLLQLLRIIPENLGLVLSEIKFTIHGLMMIVQR